VIVTLRCTLRPGVSWYHAWKAVAPCVVAVRPAVPLNDAAVLY